MEQFSVKRWTIYCHTHVATGRRYVGLTERSMGRRWSQHVTQSKYAKSRRSHFMNAIRQYGPGAFSHCVIMHLDSLESANAWEEFWIEFLDTRNPAHGFNLAKGGKHVPHPKRNPWDRPEFREKHAAARARPGYSADMSLSVRTSMTDEVRAGISERSSGLWKDDEHRRLQHEIRKSQWRDPEYRAKQAADKVARAQDPEYSTRLAAAASEAMNRPEVKVKTSRASRSLWSDPEYRARQTEARKKLWADPEYRAKMSASLSRAMKKHFAKEG